MIGTGLIHGLIGRVKELVTVTGFGLVTYDVNADNAIDRKIGSVPDDAWGRR